jgi:hypothetical protein
MVLTARLALQPLEFFNYYPKFTKEKEVPCLDSFMELADLISKI